VTAVIGTAGLTGCTNLDSYMDPTVVGRWEKTPAKVPILDRIASIEGPEDGFVEYSDVQTDDLRVQTDEYRVSPGDFIQASVQDLIQQGVPEIITQAVDPAGYIEVRQLGPIYVAGLTEQEARNRLREAARTQILNEEPLVTFRVEQRGEQVFNMMGAVARPSAYRLDRPNTRLLEALAIAGGFSEDAEFIYVIRQVSLTDPLTGGGEPGQGPGRPTGDELLDAIEDLNEDPSPGILEPAGRAPLVDLPGTAAASTDLGTAWRFMGGRWRLVQPAGENADSGEEMLSDLVAQRVIRIPVEPLVQGDARYNVVVRPGDIIRVPPQPTGVVFVGGQVNRPGVFELSRGLTLTRLLNGAVGGLSPIGVAERVDLYRVTGDGEQSVITLNYRAMMEGTMPDIYVKSNDSINVGTNFWMLPLAVIRNGFRASYGFGFLLDRNFGNDVFGAPPSNNRNF